MSDPYRTSATDDSVCAMGIDRRKLAARIIAEIRDAESLADRRSAWAWFDQKGVGLLVEALAEIDRLERQCIELEKRL